MTLAAAFALGIIAAATLRPSTLTQHPFYGSKRHVSHDPAAAITAVRTHMKGQPDSIGMAMDDISLRVLAAYGAIFFIVLYVIFSSNVPCLLFGLDGTSWVIGFKAQAAREPFSQLGVDPLQGNFDAYLPAFREYFLPEALSLLFKGADAGKAMTYAVYGMLMLVSTYALARSVGFSRGVGFFGGALFAAIALPTSLSSISWVGGIYNILPHVAQVNCVAIGIVACFWAIDSRRPAYMLVAALIAVALVLLSAASFITMTILMLPMIAVYGGASIFASNRRSDALSRVAVSIACIILPAALGMVQYALAVGGYTAFNFFGHEFMQSRASLYFASILYQSEYVGKLVVILGVVGALYGAYVGPRRLRVFAITHLAATAVFQVTAVLVVIFAEGYHGPSPLYFEFMMWPIMFLFAALAVSAAWRYAADAWQSRDKSATRPGELIFSQGLLASVPLFLVIWNVAALAEGRFANCASTDFVPIKPNAITERLKEATSTGVGAPFRGLTATFDGVRSKESIDWFSLHGNDAALWGRIGNDLRLVGLWWYDIPTLMQYSPLITPPYYLLLTEFISRPSDRQIRSALVLTVPNERMLKLWGVRFIITDFDPGFGATRVELPVPGQTEERLTELADANLGNYSPTDVRRIDNFHDGLALLHDANFEGSRMVVTEQPPVGPFVPAQDAKLVYQKTGFSIEASSSGRSILVLPVQYSRCWSVSGTGDAVLFRANLMQLGVSFTGKLDANLVFRFGPFLASACRIADMKDMERLGIREARAH